MPENLYCSTVFYRHNKDTGLPKSKFRVEDFDKNEIETIVNKHNSPYEEGSIFRISLNDHQQITALIKKEFMADVKKKYNLNTLNAGYGDTATPFKYYYIEQIGMKSLFFTDGTNPNSIRIPVIDGVEPKPYKYYIADGIGITSTRDMKVWFLHQDKFVCREQPFSKEEILVGEADEVPGLSKPEPISTSPTVPCSTGLHEEELQQCSQPEFERLEGLRNRFLLKD
jgi:hypothetical protein